MVAHSHQMLPSLMFDAPVQHAAGPLCQLSAFEKTNPNYFVRQNRPEQPGFDSQNDRSVRQNRHPAVPSPGLHSRINPGTAPKAAPTLGSFGKTVHKQHFGFVSQNARFVPQNRHLAVPVPARSQPYQSSAPLDKSAI